MHETFFLILVLTLTLPALSNTNDNDFFRSNYDESREQFLKLQTMPASYPEISVKKLEFADPYDSQLITDVAWVQAKKPNTHLIIVVSGLHGIEGFVGSAVQSRMLTNIKPNIKSDYLFVHALNPYGFKNFRRVDRSNVDLNRNLVTNPIDFTNSNNAYSNIDFFLNPKTSAQLSFFSHLNFIYNSVKLILQYSIDSVRQSILLGQHQFSKGLYFGGFNYQYQKKIMDQLHEDIIKNYDKVMIVDLHTGYGERKKLHILVNSKKQPSAAELIKVFSEPRIDFGDQKNFYKVTGDLVSYMESKSTLNKPILAVVFEYGTLNSQKVTGSIESLRRMVLENQKFQFGFEKKSESQEIDTLFKDMFYPDDNGWRQSAFEQTDIEFKKIENYLQNP